MAASFINKSGQYYMRLTGSTTAVKFAAVSDAGNVYTISINGSVVVSKPNPDIAPNVYYTSSAIPYPPGAILDNGRFPGAESVYVYAGSNTRDYLLTFTSNGSDTIPYLGGQPLSWGQHAYPGQGYITNPVKAKVRQSGSWNKSGLSIEQSGIFKNISTASIRINGEWKPFYQKFQSSQWFNLVDLQDDNLDFAIKVIAVN